MKGRDTIEIDHPAGEEIQWDWFERRHAPWGGTAYVLLGTLPHSSRIRGVLAESMDQAHLIEAMDGVLRRIGGTAQIWRTDRLATVIRPGTRDVQASFAPVAKHYGAIVEPCPPRRGNRKGSVEAAVRFCSGRWWRTLSATDPEEAQLSLDRFLAAAGDARERRASDGVGAAPSASSPTPSRCWRCRHCRSRPRSPSNGSSTTTPPSPSGATATRCRRGCRARRCEVRHRLGTATSRSTRFGGACSPTHRWPRRSGHARAHPRAPRRPGARRARRVHTDAAV